MKYQIQFKNNTLTLPSLIWLRDFLTKHRGIQNTHQIVGKLQSGEIYQDKEMKIIVIKGD